MLHNTTLMHWLVLKITYHTYINHVFTADGLLCARPIYKNGLADPSKHLHLWSSWWPVKFSWPNQWTCVAYLEHRAYLACISCHLKGPCLVLVIEWQPRWTNVCLSEIHRWFVHRYMCVSNTCHVGENGLDMLQCSHMWWRSSLHMRHDIELCD
jgi:hypothetical protein